MYLYVIVSDWMFEILYPLLVLELDQHKRSGFTYYGCLLTFTSVSLQLICCVLLLFFFFLVSFAISNSQSSVGISSETAEWAMQGMFLLSE